MQVLQVFKHQNSFSLSHGTIHHSYVLMFSVHINSLVSSLQTHHCTDVGDQTALGSTLFTETLCTQKPVLHIPFTGSHAS